MAKPIGREAAEALAIAALGLIASDEGRLHAFLDATGADPGSLRTAVRDPEFLGGVMAHVIGDDTLVVEVAEAGGVRPEAVMQAAAALGAVWERDGA